MKNMNNGTKFYGITSPSYGLSTITLPIETPLRPNTNKNNSGALVALSHGNTTDNTEKSCNGDLASVDSSDTYASCQTHPFLSQGDLTADMVDAICDLDDIDINNLYINPLEKDSAVVISQVKKSASGDTALRSLGDSPMEDDFQHFQSYESRERGSRVSLNETPVPKHRKTRFQQFAKPKARFEVTKTSQESLSEGKKNRRSSFMPSKSLASATKLINQHLFGIQNVGPKGKLNSNTKKLLFQIIITNRTLSNTKA